MQVCGYLSKAWQQFCPLFRVGLIDLHMSTRRSEHERESGAYAARADDSNRAIIAGRWILS